jgi:TRAP-type transport system small permease protein
MFKGLVGILGKGLHIAEWTSLVAAGAIITGMMFLTTLDVTGRYFFNSPIQGAYEVSEMSLVALVFLGISFVQREKGHVRVDIVIAFLPKSIDRYLNVFSLVFALMPMAIVTWQSGLYFWEVWTIKDHSSGIIPIPLWPVALGMVLGAGLLSIQLILDIADEISQLFQRA